MENYKSEPNNKSSIFPFHSLWCPFTMSSVFQFACYGWENGKFYCFSLNSKSQMVTRLLFPSSKYYLVNCIEFSSLALAMYLATPIDFETRGLHVVLFPSPSGLLSSCLWLCAEKRVHLCLTWEFSCLQIFILPHYNTSGVVP